MCVDKNLVNAGEAKIFIGPAISTCRMHIQN